MQIDGLTQVLEGRKGDENQQERHQRPLVGEQSPLRRGLARQNQAHQTRRA